MRRVLWGIDRSLNLVISTVVVLLLAFMVAVSFTQVLLRNLTGEGIPWAEIILQHAVLAVGMFGAVIAARQSRQIAIDVLSRISGPAMRRVLGWLSGLFTMTVSAILARASWIFVSSEKQFGGELVDGTPAWPFQIVIPAGFILLALQVLLNLLLGRTIQTEFPGPAITETLTPESEPATENHLPAGPAEDQP